MVSVDGSIIVLMANFLILIWIMNMVLYKPIRKILIQRKDKVSGLETRISDCGDKIEEQDQAYISGLKEARLQGKKEKDAILQVAADEEQAIIGKINEKAQADLAEVKGKIVKEMDAVRENLEKEVDAFVEAIGQKILGRAA